MRKLYALLTSILFAIELAIIAYSLPTITQILFPCSFLALLFYFFLKSENLINIPKSIPIPQKLKNSKAKKTKAKTKIKDVPQATPVEPEKQVELKKEKRPKPKKTIVLPTIIARLNPKKQAKADKKAEEESKFTKQWRDMEREAKK